MSLLRNKQALITRHSSLRCIFIMTVTQVAFGRVLRYEEFRYTIPRTCGCEHSTAWLVRPGLPRFIPSGMMPAIGFMSAVDREAKLLRSLKKAN